MTDDETDAKAAARAAYVEGWRKRVNADNFSKRSRETAKSNFETWWRRNYE